MKKLYYFLIPLLLLTPLLVSADSYDGPYCFEDPKMNTQEWGSSGSSTVRGTCKEIKIYDSVSIDPNLKKDYLLGSHYPIGYDCYRASCSTYTEYSETIIVTSTSTIVSSTVQTGGVPKERALFDKTFFIPSLTKLYKNEGISFSPDSFPDVSMHILKKDEIDTIEKKMGYSLFERHKKDMLIKIDNYDLRTSTNNDVITYLYQEYGKYIHAPKGDVYESSYVDVEKSTGLLTNKDLGVTITQSRYDLPTVSPTSPLASITNFWLYTKKNGKLILAWQKTEYTLDDGSVKTITKDDKNVSAAMLFTKKPQAESVAMSSSSSTAQIIQPPQDIKKNIKTVPPPLPVEEVGIFQKIFYFFASLFN